MTTPFLVPTDMASDCVDIVMEIAEIARSNPSAKVIALTQEGITEILQIEDRIEAFNRANTKHEKGE